ncbi:MAG: neutral/alkaline non-lysosomal ceramidase N-terminal domain-containing protein, partial [Candidatus Poribacteria bacterium]
MSEFMAGAATVDITPPLGGKMAGYAGRDDGSQAIADPLQAKALVFADGATKAAIIANDLLGLPSARVAGIRERVAAATDIPPASVMVCCSHTHFGPEVEDGSADAYVDVLCDQLATAAILANASLRPARMGHGAGSVDTISFNRHTLLPGGKAQTNYRMPADTSGLTFGPIDPTVRVLRVEGADGAPIASLINFACHPVTSTDRMLTLSADYPGHAMNVIESEEGGVCLFGLGCAGNIVPIRREGAYPRMIGQTLGGEALKVWQWIETSDETSDESHAIRSASHDLVLPLKEGGEETIEVSVLAVGEIAFLALPGEIFVEIGLDIANRAGAHGLFTFTMGNGYVGYIATRA